VPGTVLFAARSRSRTEICFLEIRQVGQRVLLVKYQRNGTPIHTRAFHSVEQAREEAIGWCDGVADADWHRGGQRNQELPPGRMDGAADTGSLAMHILNEGFAVLYHYRKTTPEFLAQLPIIGLAGAMAWFMLVTFIAVVWSDAFERLLFHPLPIALMYVAFVVQEWRDIGERRSSIDLSRRELFREERMPNRRGGVQSERVPFAHLLLLRYWRCDSESESAAFMIRLQVGKNAHGQDHGYLLHLEPGDGDPAVAEARTSEIAARLAAVTGIEYRDMSPTPAE